MTYTRAQVEAFWIHVRARGRHKDYVIPVSAMVLGEAESFALIRLPEDRVEAIPDDESLAERYAATPGTFPPAIGFVEDGISGPFVNLTDGNHRVTAARIRGDTHVLVFVPVQELRWLPAYELVDGSGWVQV